MSTAQNGKKRKRVLSSSSHDDDLIEVPSRIGSVNPDLAPILPLAPGKPARESGRDAQPDRRPDSGIVHDGAYRKSQYFSARRILDQRTLSRGRKGGLPIVKVQYLVEWDSYTTPANALESQWDKSWVDDSDCSKDLVDEWAALKEKRLNSRIDDVNDIVPDSHVTDVNNLGVGAASPLFSFDEGSEDLRHRTKSLLLGTVTALAEGTPEMQREAPARQIPNPPTRDSPLIGETLLSRMLERATRVSPASDTLHSTHQRETATIVRTISASQDENLIQIKKHEPFKVARRHGPDVSSAVTILHEESDKHDDVAVSAVFRDLFTQSTENSLRSEEMVSDIPAEILLIDSTNPLSTKSSVDDASAASVSTVRQEDDLASVVINITQDSAPTQGESLQVAYHDDLAKSSDADIVIASTNIEKILPDPGMDIASDESREGKARVASDNIQARDGSVFLDDVGFGDISPTVQSILPPTGTRHGVRDLTSTLGDSPRENLIAADLGLSEDEDQGSTAEAPEFNFEDADLAVKGPYVPRTTEADRAIGNASTANAAKGKAIIEMTEAREIREDAMPYGNIRIDSTLEEQHDAESPSSSLVQPNQERSTYDTSAAATKLIETDTILPSRQHYEDDDPDIIKHSVVVEEASSESPSPQGNDEDPPPDLVIESVQVYTESQLDSEISDEGQSEIIAKEADSHDPLSADDMAAVHVVAQKPIIALSDSQHTVTPDHLVEAVSSGTQRQAADMDANSLAAMTQSLGGKSPAEETSAEPTQDDMRQDFKGDGSSPIPLVISNILRIPMIDFLQIVQQSTFVDDGQRQELIAWLAHGSTESIEGSKRASTLKLGHVIQLVNDDAHDQFGEASQQSNLYIHLSPSGSIPPESQQINDPLSMPFSITSRTVEPALDVIQEVIDVHDLHAMNNSSTGLEESAKLLEAKLLESEKQNRNHLVDLDFIRSQYAQASGAATQLAADLRSKEKECKRLTNMVSVRESFLNSRENLWSKRVARLQRQIDLLSARFSVDAKKREAEAEDRHRRTIGSIPEWETAEAGENEDNALVFLCDWEAGAGQPLCAAALPSRDALMEHLQGVHIDKM